MLELKNKEREDKDIDIVEKYLKDMKNDFYPIFKDKIDIIKKYILENNRNIDREKLNKIFKEFIEEYIKNNTKEYNFLIETTLKKINNLI